jgi:hypothetical protein
MFDETMDLTEAGILLGLSYQQVRTLMMTGAFGRPRKLGGKWRVESAAVHHFAAQRADSATGEAVAESVRALPSSFAERGE